MLKKVRLVHYLESKRLPSFMRLNQFLWAKSGIINLNVLITFNKITCAQNLPIFTVVQYLFLGTLTWCESKSLISRNQSRYKVQIIKFRLYWWSLKFKIGRDCSLRIILGISKYQKFDFEKSEIWILRHESP